MKKIFTLLAVLTISINLNAQKFHKKYAYTNEIMNGSSSVLVGNRIYSASSSMMMQGSVSIQKTDLAGNLEITKRIMFGTSTPAITVRKMINSGGRLYVVGKVTPGSGSDAFLMVIDTNLSTLIYAKSYGTTGGNEDFYDIIKTSNNDLVMVGNSTVPTATTSVTKNVLFVVRANSSSGTVVYQKLFGDAGDKIAMSVVESPTGNSLFISGVTLGSNATHLLKLTNDNMGTTLAAKNMIFSSSNMSVKKMQVYSNKLFLIGGDASGNLLTVQTDTSINALVMPKYYTNFKYYDMVSAGGGNYIAGLTVPTGTVSYLASIRFDSLFTPVQSRKYPLVVVPPFNLGNGVNVVNKASQMFWIANEGWTAPGPYTNRYIVASDMALDAICDSLNMLSPGNMVNTMTPVTYTTPIGTAFGNNYFVNYTTLTPTVITLCSVTGIENVNENFQNFTIKNGVDKIIIESPYSDYVVEVYDMTGKLIYISKSNIETEEINISNYSAGIYVLQLKAKGFEQRQKIIKQ